MKMNVSQLRRIIKEEVANARISVRRRQSLSEGHSRITSRELSAWSRGDWGYISEGIEAYRIEDLESIESEAVDAAAETLGSHPDEVEFGKDDDGNLYAGGDLSGELTHMWDGAEWAVVDQPVKLIS